MGLRLHEVVIDCADPQRLSDFWAEVLGWPAIDSESDEHGLILVELGPPPGSPEEGIAPTLIFLRNPDRPTGKNRLHLDVVPESAAQQAAEVARLEGLGAARADIGQGPNVGWVVMTDPERNVFCVLRPHS